LVPDPRAQAQGLLQQLLCLHPLSQPRTGDTEVVERERNSTLIPGLLMALQSLGQDSNRTLVLSAHHRPHPRDPAHAGGDLEVSDFGRQLSRLAEHPRRVLVTTLSSDQVGACA
jgi:hypothetical protein